MDNLLSARATVPDHWKWFVEGRYGLFIHWGPSSVYGRGIQGVFREHMDMGEYERATCEWNPAHCDAKLWASTAKKAGMKYAVLVASHHDGYCLWDTAYTDYSSASQAPKRDFVKEFVDAFRAEGLVIGLYYSWLDWRVPAFLEGPEKNPESWAVMKTYMHNQVEELLTNYGRIDYFWFDGTYPRYSEDLGSVELKQRMLELQPHILLNNSLGRSKFAEMDNKSTVEGADNSSLGNVVVCENQVIADPSNLWECCQVSSWRQWGYSPGERWRSSESILDILTDCAVKGGGGGGNLLLNVGPQPDGQFPPEFVERVLEIGQWLEVHGECVYGSDGGDITEFTPSGRQTTKGNNLYLIYRFWHGDFEIKFPDFITPVRKVTLLTTGQELSFTRKGDDLYIQGLPKDRPTALFPVIKIECEGKPEANEWGKQRVWTGNPQRIADWARSSRGESVFVGGEERMGRIKA